MAIRIAAGTLALAGMVCAGPALADVQGRATFGNLRVTLFDLDLSDAVTPSITFSVPSAATPTWESGTVSVQYSADAERFHEGYSKQIIAAPGLPATVAYAGQAHAGAEASTTHATALGQSLSGSLQLGANDEQTRFTLMALAYGGNWHFTLSPNTGVTFTADFTLDGNTTLLPSHDQSLYARAFLFAFDRQRVMYYSDEGTMEVGTRAGVPLAIDDSDILSVSMNNPGPAASPGELSLNLRFSASLQPVSAVPEPSSWAMLLAGGLFGLLHARRRAGTRRASP